MLAQYHSLFDLWQGLRQRSHARQAQHAPIRSERYVQYSYTAIALSRFPFVLLLSCFTCESQWRIVTFFDVDGAQLTKTGDYSWEVTYTETRRQLLAVSPKSEMKLKSDTFHAKVQPGEPVQLVVSGVQDDNGEELSVSFTFSLSAHVRYFWLIFYCFLHIVPGGAHDCTIGSFMFVRSKTGRIASSKRPTPALTRLGFVLLNSRAADVEFFC